MNVIVSYPLNLSVKEDAEFLRRKLDGHPKDDDFEPDDPGIIIKGGSAPKSEDSATQEPKMNREYIDVGPPFIAVLSCGCTRETDTLKKKKYLEANGECWKCNPKLRPST